MKNIVTAYVLCVLGFFGFAGLHRFYLGKFGSGALYLFTFGFLGIGTIIDLFILPRMVDEYNHRYGKEFGDMEQKG